MRSIQVKISHNVGRQELQDHDDRMRLELSTEVLLPDDFAIEQAGQEAGDTLRRLLTGVLDGMLPES